MNPMHVDFSSSCIASPARGARCALIALLLAAGRRRLVHRQQLAAAMRRKGSRHQAAHRQAQIAACAGSRLSRAAG